MVHKIDLFVGKKIKQKRIESNISLSELGRSVGVSFQQIQKYESGMNRVSASMLWEISKTFKTTPNAFFPVSKEETEKYDLLSKINLQEKKTFLDFMLALTTPPLKGGSSEIQKSPHICGDFNFLKNIFTNNQA